MHRNAQLNGAWKTPKNGEIAWQTTTTNKTEFNWSNMKGSKMNNRQACDRFQPKRSSIFNREADGVNMEFFWLCVFQYMGNTDLIALRGACHIFKSTYLKNWRRSLRIDLCPDGKEMLQALGSGQYPPMTRIDLLPTLLHAAFHRARQNVDNDSGHPGKSTDRPYITLRHLERFVLGLNENAMDLSDVKTCHISDGNSVLTIGSLLDAVRLSKSSMNNDSVDPLINLANEALTSIPESPNNSPVLFCNPVSPLQPSQIREIYNRTKLRPRGLAAELSSSNAHLLAEFLTNVDTSVCEHLIVRLSDRNFESTAKKDLLQAPISLKSLPIALRGVMLDIDSRRIDHKISLVSQGEWRRWPDMAFIQIHMHVMDVREFPRIRDFLLKIIRGAAKLRTLRIYFVGPTHFPLTRPPSKDWVSEYESTTMVLSETTPPYVTKSFSLLRVSFPGRVAGLTDTYLRTLHDLLREQIMRFDEAIALKGKLRKGLGRNDVDNADGNSIVNTGELQGGLVELPFWKSRINLLRAIIAATVPHIIHHQEFFHFPPTGIF